ncbi:MAG TPA: hypothetical protein VJ731_00170 [Terriglobales bacterium]|nr:hypothetical protein [Terriglobales bacterium]
MKFQNLEQFRKQEYGASFGPLMQFALAILGGAATLAAVFTLVHLGA